MRGAIAIFDSVLSPGANSSRTQDEPHPSTLQDAAPFIGRVDGGPAARHRPEALAALPRYRAPPRRERVHIGVNRALWMGRDA